MASGQVPVRELTFFDMLLTGKWSPSFVQDQLSRAIITDAPLVMPIAEVIEVIDESVPDDPKKWAEFIEDTEAEREDTDLTQVISNKPLTRRQERAERKATNKRRRNYDL
jgi:hypothetical protein